MSFPLPLLTATLRVLVVWPLTGAVGLLRFTLWLLYATLRPLLTWLLHATLWLLTCAFRLLRFTFGLLGITLYRLLVWLLNATLWLLGAVLRKPHIGLLCACMLYALSRFMTASARRRAPSPSPPVHRPVCVSPPRWGATQAAQTAAARGAPSRVCAPASARTAAPSPPPAHALAAPTARRPRAVEEAEGDNSVEASHSDNGSLSTSTATSNDDDNRPAWAPSAPRAAGGGRHSPLRGPSRSERAGLSFPVGRASRHLKETIRDQDLRLGDMAPIYLAAVGELLARRILRSAGRISRNSGSTRCEGFAFIWLAHAMGK